MPRVGGTERKKCPLCGGQIEVSDLYQYSRNYIVTKSGRLSKKYTVRDCGSMEASIAGCDCGAYWEVGDFDVTSERRCYPRDYYDRRASRGRRVEPLSVD